MKTTKSQTTNNMQTETNVKVKKEKKKRGIVHRIFDVFFSILMFLSILLLIFSTIIAFKNKDNPEDAYLFGYKPVFILTGSMEPVLKTNGVAIVKQIEYDDVKVDDIIVFKIDDKVITHRVIEKTEEGIRTKGDNNNVQDAYLLKEENVKAKVICVFNGVADMITLFKTQKTFKIITIGIAIAVMFVSFIFLFSSALTSIIEKFDAKKNKKDKNAKIEKSKKEKSKKISSQSSASVPEPVCEQASSITMSTTASSQKDEIDIILEDIPKEKLNEEQQRMVGLILEDMDKINAKLIRKKYYCPSCGQVYDKKPLICDKCHCKIL